jgi:hypothetical protein
VCEINNLVHTYDKYLILLAKSGMTYTTQNPSKGEEMQEGAGVDVHVKAGWAAVEVRVAEAKAAAK